MTGAINVSDIYMDIIRPLPDKDKLDLISAIIKSMKTAVPRKQPKDIFAGFSTDWGGSLSTEDYADELRSEMVGEARTVEDW